MDMRTREGRAAKAAAAADQAAAAIPEVEQVNTPRPDAPVVEADRPPSRNEPRRRGMEEIEAREARESASLEEQRVTPVEDPKPPKAEDIIAPAQTVEAIQTPAVEAPKMVKVKVDGVESEVSQADIDEAGGVTAYQRDKASENRLLKANQTLAEAQRTQAQLAAWVQSQIPKQPTQTDDQFIASKVDTIRFGTPEESAAALREVMQRGRPDENVITQRAVSQMRQDGAIENFKKEFQDVVSNPILLRAAVALENERRAQNTGDWNEFYRKIGNEVRSVTGRPSQSAPSLATSTTDTPSTVDKDARKASIVNLPTAAARAEMPKEAKPETREDMLSSMKKARGLPTG